MTFQLVEPILLIGLGGVGARLAEKVKKSLNSDCLLISHDQKDLTIENSIKISTKSVVNPINPSNKRLNIRNFQMRLKKI